MCWFKHKAAHISFTTKLVFWAVIKVLRFALGYCALSSCYISSRRSSPALPISPPSLRSPPPSLFFPFHCSSFLSLPTVTPLFVFVSSFLASLEWAFASLQARLLPVLLCSSMLHCTTHPHQHSISFLSTVIHVSLLSPPDLIGLAFFHRQCFAVAALMSRHSECSLLLSWAASHLCPLHSLHPKGFNLRCLSVSCLHWHGKLMWISLWI